MIWSQDDGNAERVFVWDSYTMKEFFQLLYNTYEGPGMLGEDLEDGEAQRLLNHFGLTWSGKPAARYGPLRDFKGYKAAPGFQDAPDNGKAARARTVRSSEQ